MADEGEQGKMEKAALTGDLHNVLGTLTAPKHRVTVQHHERVKQRK